MHDFFVFMKVPGGNALLRREEGSKTLQIIVLDNYVSPHKKWKKLSKEQMAVILRIQSLARSIGPLKKLRDKTYNGARS